MTTENVTIQVDDDVANIYNTASEEDQRKIQILLRLWLQELSKSPNLPLHEIMDRISDRAQARGLTLEILESILNES
jgi:hypothetical protein